MNLRFVITLALLVAACAAATAQQSDKRISPADPPSYMLPDDIQIQDAARIGNRTLVVWGTSTKDKAGTTIRGLAAQLIDGTTPVGSPQIITSGSAPVSGFVQVLPFDDHFLVLWNDRRNNEPGIYSRFFDLEGSPPTPEIRYSEGEVVSRWATIDITTGYRLLWDRRLNGEVQFFGQIVNRSGFPIGPVELLDSGSVGRALEVDSEPALFLLERTQGGSIIMYCNGAIEPRHISLPYTENMIISPVDSSAAYFDQNGAYFYKNIYDTVPDEYFSLKGKYMIGTVALSFDSSNHIRLCYLTDWGPSDGYSGYFLYDSDITQLTYDGQSGLGNPIPIKKLLWWLPYRYVSLRLDGATVYNDCNHNVRWRLLITVITRYAYDDYRKVEEVHDHAINGAGEYQSGWDGIDTTCTSIVPILPPVPSVQEVKRTLSKGTSDIQVKIDGNTLSVSAPIIPFNDSLAQDVPAVNIFGDDTYLSWRQECAPLPFAMATMDIGTQAGPASVVFEYAPEKVLPRLPEKDNNVYYNNVNTVIPLDGLSLISSAIERADNTAGDTYAQLLRTIRHSILIATDIGWVKPVSLDTFLVGANFTFHFQQEKIGLNRSNNSVAGLVSQIRNNNSLDIRLAYGFDATGNNAWVLDSVAMTYVVNGVVPIGYKELLIISGKDAWHVWDTSEVKAFSFAKSYTNARYEKLVGNTFLRSYFASDTLPTLTMELYTLDGLLQASYQAEGVSHDYCISQNRVDSSIALVWGGTGGIRMTYLDNNLNNRRDNNLGEYLVNVQISATRDSIAQPAAAIRNDTLFVVWKDYRNTIADIYGTAFPLPLSTAVSSVPGAAQNVQHLHVYPNPTSGHVTIQLPDNQRNTTMYAIIDDRGNVVRNDALADGHNNTELDLSTYPTGMYTIAITIGEQRYAQRLIIVR